MSPKPGDQLASAVDTTRVVVVRAPADVAVIACGGEPMVPATGAKPAGAPAAGGGTQLGKRYVDATGALEVLCTSAGTAELTYDGVAMEIKSAKPLPASD